MNENRPIEQLQRMAVLPVPVPPADTSLHPREETIARMRQVQERALAARRKADSRRRALALLVAASIPLLAGSAWWWHAGSSQTPSSATAPVLAHVAAVSSGATLVHSAAPVDISGTSELRPGDVVMTGPDAPATVALPSGAAIALHRSSQLLVDWAAAPAQPTRERVSLRYGTIDVAVPKLGDGSFSVTTPDSEVVVHGTRFTVSVYQTSPGRWATDVSVEDGRVTARKGDGPVTLLPGQSWSSAAIVESQPLPSASGVVSAAPVVAVAPGATTEPGRHVPPPNTLAAENALFEQAIAAARAGDDATAIALLDKLLTTYPNSPLAGMARRERARLHREGEGKAQ